MRRFSAALLLAPLSLIACDSSRERPAYVDQLSAPEEPFVMPAGEVGTYGGRFITAGNNAPATFNPVTYTTAYAGEIIARLFVRLMRVDPETQVDMPLLATSWELMPDGTSATFHLRRGAKFSDGHPITAEDVVFSLQMLVEPTVSAPNRDLLMMGGRPFTFAAPDPFTVVIHTPQPNGSLVTLVQTVFILPKHVLEPALKAGTFNAAYGVNTPPEALVTSGPWRLKQYLPNERTVLTRNPHWFGVDATGQRLPYLDELVFMVVPDEEATNLKFRAGEIDTISRPASADYQWYRENQEVGKFTLHDLGPELGSWFMFFNLNEAKHVGQAAVGSVKYGWFKHAAFRRAVSSAIDRDAMIRSIYYGDGVKYWSMSTPGDKLWAIPDVPHDDYNARQAQELLASLDMNDRDGDGVIEDAGHHPVTFTLMVTGPSGTRLAAANFIRDDLAQGRHQSRARAAGVQHAEHQRQHRAVRGRNHRATSCEARTSPRRTMVALKRLAAPVAHRATEARLTRTSPC